MPIINLTHNFSSGHALKDWFKHLYPSEQDFIRTKLGSLVDLIDIELDLGFLRNLLEKWDANTFSFKFGDFELSPTLEEYIQLARLPHIPGLLPLERTPSLKNDLPIVLNVTPTVASSLITSHIHVNIEELLLCERSVYVAENEEGQLSARAFILAVIGMIIFPFTKRSIHARAVHITRALLLGKPIIPTILGETLSGLTRINIQARGGVRNHDITFCLPLLLTWFSSHLGISAYKYLHDQDLLQHISRRISLPPKGFTHWKSFFESLTSNHFVHMSRHFKTGPIMFAVKRSAYIPILGLHGSSYYVPIRVAHEFGGFPKVPPHQHLHKSFYADDLQIHKEWEQPRIIEFTCPIIDLNEYDLMVATFKHQRLALERSLPSTSR
ncbi:hypothetical protein MLD38_014544 [Melastoma candidum]|uniref:Uncharacterized protein n=1 Tax=Melastoma candidum TaxID=119954 RepID=A0ACB9RDA6_9MYRT|nr:hypothetical protein MLD38_014544 [Melastoma candidum]